MDEKPLSHVTVEMLRRRGRKSSGRFTTNASSDIRRSLPLLSTTNFYVALHREWAQHRVNSGEDIWDVDFYDSYPPDPMDSQNMSSILSQIKNLPLFGWEQEKGGPE